MHHYDIVLTKVKPFLNSSEQNAANIASEWYSPVHQDVFRSFDLSCLNSNHRAAVKYSLREYDKEITNVANGVNIFAKQNIKLLKHIQATYFACPSQGHFVEGGVKDAGFTGQTGAEERRRNNMAIIRSHTVRVTNALSEGKQEHFKKVEYKQRPSGSKLTSTFLDVCKKQYRRMEILNLDIEEAKKLLSQRK